METEEAVQLTAEDTEDLAEALGITALEQEVGSLRLLVSELLTYVNNQQRALLQLQGEPIVTEQVQAHVQPGGVLEWDRRPPPLPSNLNDIESIREALKGVRGGR